MPSAPDLLNFCGVLCGSSGLFTPKEETSQTKTLHPSVPFLKAGSVTLPVAGGRRTVWAERSQPVGTRRWVSPSWPLPQDRHGEGLVTGGHASTSGRAQRGETREPPSTGTFRRRSTWREPVEVLPAGGGRVGRRTQRVPEKSVGRGVRPVSEPSSFLPGVGAHERRRLFSPEGRRSLEGDAGSAPFKG